MLRTRGLIDRGELWLTPFANTRQGHGDTIVRSYKRGAAPAQDPSRVTIEYWDPLSRAADPEID